jgi:hypothetical protein
VVRVDHSLGLCNPRPASPLPGFPAPPRGQWPHPHNLQPGRGLAATSMLTFTLPPFPLISADSLDISPFLTWTPLAPGGHSFLFRARVNSRVCVLKIVLPRELTLRAPHHFSPISLSASPCHYLLASPSSPRVPPHHHLANPSVPISSHPSDPPSVHLLPSRSIRLHPSLRSPHRSAMPRLPLPPCLSRNPAPPHIPSARIYSRKNATPLWCHG